MALVKRGKTWHTHFFVDGQRFRQSLGTSDWREALAREKDLITQASQGNLVASRQSFAKLAFPEAADSYFNGRKLELGESSRKKERQLLAKPCEFFQRKCLYKITSDDVLRFREWRSETGVGPATINMEVGVIRRMLKRAKRWHLLGADIRPLKEPRSIGRALTYDEKLTLLRTAGQNEDWHRVQAAMSLALCTTMRGCEIKRLQWRDVDFINRMILVRTSKTEAGQRIIPMNDEAYEMVRRLRERAKGFNGIGPQHYVFPACEHGHVNPARNQHSFRTAWRSLTRAIRCPACGKLQAPAENCANVDCKAPIRRIKSPLVGLRFHDLRHHAITELAESQVSDQTIMAIAGHVSHKMLARYSHVRTEARRQAVLALSAKPIKGRHDAVGGTGYDTNNDTNRDLTDLAEPEVIEKMVGPCGLEPQTSSVSRKRSSQLSYGPSDENILAQQHQAFRSTTTAEPYASTSVTPCITSLAS
jgi:integrase